MHALRNAMCMACIMHVPGVAQQISALAWLVKCTIVPHTHSHVQVRQHATAGFS